MKKILNNIFFLAVIMIFQSCGDQKSDFSATTAYFAATDSGIQAAGIKMVPISTPVGKFKVWTKKFGNNPRIKILLLHGGPAMTHEYMECFESFFPREGFEFYEYDQLGSYYSDQPADSSLWTTERFVEEVEQVRKALGLTKDNFYLLGNSWGGILGMEYAFKYQQNLKALIICNMMASASDYDRYAEEVLSRQIDPKVLDTLKSLELAGKTQDPLYMKLLIPHFYNLHICRLPEWPEPVNRSFKHANGVIYTMMQGPSEFGIAGRLTNWERKADLPKLEIPILTVGAKYDTMDPEHMRWMSTQVKNGKFLYCPQGSHLSMWDDQQVFMRGVINFIHEVDNAQR